MSKKLKVALVIGHKPNSPGACTPGQGRAGCEYYENGSFVRDLHAYLEKRGVVESIVIERTGTYEQLPAQINSLHPDFILSFHSNAATGRASGTETLYCALSKKGKLLASLVQASMVAVLNLPDRGILPRGRHDRGGLLLWRTHAPCVLLEPFFNDNLSDDARFHAVRVELKQAIGHTIEAYAVGGLKK